MVEGRGFGTGASRLPRPAPDTRGRAGEPSSRPRTALQGLLALGALALGLVVGVAAVALHAYWWGLTLAVAAGATTAYALPAGWWARMPFAFGCAAVVAYLAFPRAEGDYVIAGDLAGYLLLGLTLALAVAAVVTLRPTRGGDSGESEEASLG